MRTWKGPILFFVIFAVAIIYLLRIAYPTRVVEVSGDEILFDTLKLFAIE